MSSNFPPFFNLSLHPPASSPNSSTHIFDCHESEVGFQAFLVLVCIYVLLFLPLSVFVYYLGLQRCRTQSAASAPMDVFTYNIIAIETIGMFGCCLYIFSGTPQIKLVGDYVYNIVLPGQVLLHMLTCLERYIAVAHPVFYLSLRKAVGVRNGIIGFVWVGSLGWVGLTALYRPSFPIIPFIVFMAVSLTLISFFSFFVLRTLIRPGPGERGGDRERMAQSKRRAIHIIMVITGVLLLRFVGNLVCVLISIFMVLSDMGVCITHIFGLFFCVPSSYILPLLFLQRVGKLQMRKIPLKK